MAIFVVALAATPCCTDDNCKDEVSQSQSGCADDKGPCSPFVSCVGCPGATSVVSIALADVPEIKIEKRTPPYKREFYNSYAAKIWQPPKIVC